MDRGGRDCMREHIVGSIGGRGRVKNYYWPLAVFRPKLPNGQPLSKVVGRLGQPSVKIVKAS